MIASSSAITTRVVGSAVSGTAGALGQRAESSAEIRIEQAVLLLLELAHRGADGVAVPGQRAGMAAGLAGLHVGERGLGHERPAHVLGFLLEECELLVGHGELGAHPLEPFAHVDEAPLEHRLRHDKSLGGTSLLASGVCGRRPTVDSAPGGCREAPPSEKDG